MSEKPEKKVYPPDQQEEIYKHMKKELKRIFNSDHRIKEIRIYGSCMKKQFGKYVKTFRPGTPTARDKSDIDAIFLIEWLDGDEIKLKSG